MNRPEVAFDDNGLIVAVVQDDLTGDVLMVAYMNEAALEATLSTGQVHFWSRSRQELWRKGATSGNTLELVAIKSDCDSDALLVAARPIGPACHTGSETCFGNTDHEGFRSLEQLSAVIRSRAADRPAGSYTTSLVEAGVDTVARKVLEEAGEVAFAAKNHAAGTGPESEVSAEAADLMYHLLVLLAERDIPARDMLDELRRRS